MCQYSILFIFMNFVLLKLFKKVIINHRPKGWCYYNISQS